MDGLRRNGCVENFELSVSDGLVAERPLSAPPLEALHDAFSTRVQPVFVHLCSPVGYVRSVDAILGFWARGCVLVGVGVGRVGSFRDREVGSIL